jgi:hypothetical protein
MRGPLGPRLLKLLHSSKATLHANRPHGGRCQSGGVSKHQQVSAVPAVRREGKKPELVLSLRNSRRISRVSDRGGIGVEDGRDGLNSRSTQEDPPSTARFADDTDDESRHGEDDDCFHPNTEEGVIRQPSSSNKDPHPAFLSQLTQ